MIFHKKCLIELSDIFQLMTNMRFLYIDSQTCRTNSIKLLSAALFSPCALEAFRTSESSGTCSLHRGLIVVPISESWSSIFSYPFIAILIPPSLKQMMTEWQTQKMLFFIYKICFMYYHHGRLVIRLSLSSTSTHPRTLHINERKDPGIFIFTCHTQVIRHHHVSHLSYYPETSTQDTSSQAAYFL